MIHTVFASFWRKNDTSESFPHLQMMIAQLLKDLCRELIFLSLEPSGNEDSEYTLKKLSQICEQNGNAKHLATPFPTALWGEGGFVGQMGPQR